MSKMTHIKEKIFTKKFLLPFFTGLLVFILLFSYFFIKHNKYYVFKIQSDEKLSIKVPLLNPDIKNVANDIFLHNVSFLTFTNDPNRYSGIKKYNNIDYSKEFIVFDIFQDFKLTKDNNVLDHISLYLHNDKKYAFGNIESAWMGSSGLFSTDQTSSIVLTVVLKINNYYIQGLLRATCNKYTKEDEKRFEVLLSNWAEKFKKMNNI